MSSYSVSAYGRMASERGRTGAYRDALAAAIRPGMAVVDLGAGSGVLALLAGRLGARKVYAIESADVIQLARELAARNGLAEVIEFIHGPSQQAHLPELAGVLVTDLRGCLPLHGGALPAIADARRRFLQPGGILIPHSDHLYTALVRIPAVYEKLTLPWEQRAYDLDFGAGRTYVVNLWYRESIGREQLVTEPVRWATLDYTTLEEPDVRGAAEWSITESAAAHGLAVWFDAELLGDIGFSSAPGHAESIYGQAFFPWQHPVELAPGDRVFISLDARLIGNHYVWRWDTRVLSGPAVKAEFKQSTFFSEPLSPATLRKHAHSYMPSKNEDGVILEFVLQRMDGMASVESIGQELAEHFPQRFSTLRAAIDHVAAVSLEYSR